MKKAKITKKLNRVDCLLIELDESVSNCIEIANGNVIAITDNGLSVEKAQSILSDIKSAITSNLSDAKISYYVCGDYYVTDRIHLENYNVTFSIKTITGRCDGLIIYKYEYK